MTITDGYAPEPEQSTLALIAHHPQAIYFGTRQGRLPAEGSPDDVIRGSASDPSLFGELDDEDPPEERDRRRGRARDGGRGHLSARRSRALGAAAGRRGAARATRCTRRRRGSPSARASSAGTRRVSIRCGRAPSPWRTAPWPRACASFAACAPGGWERSRVARGRIGRLARTAGDAARCSCKGPAGRQGAADAAAISPRAAAGGRGSALDLDRRAAAEAQRGLEALARRARRRRARGAARSARR